MTSQMNELAFYTLAGAANSACDLIDEVRSAEAMGIGAAFISERLNIKEAMTITGAAAAVSEQIGIGTAATNHNTRHPLITAAHGTTMRSLAGDRFTLGIGRGVDASNRAKGLPPITTAQMEDFVGLMRRLWRGEMIKDHDGPAGSWPVLQLRGIEPAHIPMSLVAFGPNSLALGGRCFDAVVLHTFFTDETTMRAVAQVKEAAEQAGRDPASVRVWSCFATIGDHLPEPVRLKKTIGRLATYLQAYGDLMVRTNYWDPAVLDRFRADEMVRGFRGAIDHIGTTDQLEHISTLLPDEWLAPAASGSAAQCVDAVRGQFELGCDGVILHGASPAELAPIVDEYRRTRPSSAFESLVANPGG
jgi:probable F420-dependent oxidoreductase